MSRVAYPYPTLFPHVQSQGAWSATIDDRIRLFRDGSGSWDYDSELSISCTLPWRPERIFEAAGLSELFGSARLAVVLGTGIADGTGRRHVAHDIPVSDLAASEGGNGATLRLSVDSAGLCSRLKARLIIYSPGGTVGGLEIRSGSVLYEEDATLALEGDLASFPIRAFSFSASGLGDGLWLVECSAESPEDPLLSTVSLQLNTDRQDFIDQLRAEHPDTGLLRWTLRADVMASVLSTLLLSDEIGFDASSAYADGSLGSVACGWLSSLGLEGSSSIRRIREEIRREPGRFRQRCQAASAPSESAE